MSDLLETAIGETIDVLQPLFVKPKLTKTLLAKPPFRFIHDIVTATLNATGFPPGYYTLEELDSSNMKESKTAKLSFLDKLIHLVNDGNGSTIEVSSVKIVSGLEPVSTNKLLTALGRIAQDLDIDREALVKRCLGELDDIKGRSENNHIDAADAIVMSSTKQSISSRGENNTAGSGSVGFSSMVERVSGCNEDMDQTRNMLSKIFSKPKCSDTLLSKPPFRFIHDIIIAVGKATQFDLLLIFSEVELESSNVSEKQAKLQFLKKLIEFIASQTGKPIDVSPIKIIAGLEPGRTRYLLQLFTVVATSKVETFTIGDGDGDSIKLNVQSYVVNDGKSNSSSLEVPTMRPANSNSGNSLSTAYASGVTEPEGRFRDAMPSSLRLSAEMGHDIVDANNALSVANRRPATAYETKPMNGKGADTFPSEMYKSKPNEVVPNLITHAKLIEGKGTDGMGDLNLSNIKDTIHPDKSLNQPEKRTGMPLTLSGIDFTTLAGAVRHIAESTLSLGKYIDAVHDDLETLVSERNRWIDAQHF